MNNEDSAICAGCGNRFFIDELQEDNDQLYCAMCYNPYTAEEYEADLRREYFENLGV